MALSRKAFAEVRFVARHDPAVDLEKTDWTAYLDSGYAADKLVIREGEEPTVWRIAPLTARQKVAVASQPVSLKRSAMAIICGLRGIENYIVERADGSTMELAIGEEDKTKAEGGGKILKDAWLEKANLPAEDLIAVGDAIENISEARPLS